MVSQGLDPSELLDQVAPAPEGRDRWKHRRLLVFASVIVLGWSAILVAILGDPNNALHRELLSSGIWAAVGIIGVYIGAPVIDDWLPKKGVHHGPG